MAVEGWKEEQLGNLVDIRKGKKVETYDTFSDGYVPYIGAENFSGIVTKYASPNNAILCTNKDVLMLWDGERSGLVSRNWQGAVSSTVARLSSKGKIDPKFLYHFLSHKFKWIQSNRTGQAVPHVPKNLAEMLTIPVPPQLEQKKISEILESVDDAIAKTEGVIAQTQRVKQGLLQQLLTRGIGHTKFKQTELGEIPESWEVGTIENLGKIVTGKTPSTFKPEYWGGDIPFITPGDIQDDSSEIKVVSRSVTEDGANQVKILPPGSVLVTCIGSTIGKLGISKFLSTCNQQINAILCENERSAFVYEMVASKREYIRNLAGKQAVPLINKSTFSSISIPIPSSSEQIEISLILEKFYFCLEESKKHLDDLRKLKAGLMSDLLTGRVRVKVDAKSSGKVGEAA